MHGRKGLEPVMQLSDNLVLGKGLVKCFAVGVAKTSKIRFA
jgi:hypothetical protein